MPPLLLEIEDGPLDDVDRAAARDLRIGLDVGHQQLDRREVGGDRRAQAWRQVRREQARVLRAWRVDDQIRLCQMLHEARVQADHLRAALQYRARAHRAPPPAAPPARPRAGQSLMRKMSWMRLRRLASTIASSVARRSPDRIERHEVGVGAVGHVLDHAGGQPDERRVVVHGPVEPPLAEQERPAEHQVPDGAVREVERPIRRGPLAFESRETFEQRRPLLDGNGLGECADAALQGACLRDAVRHGNLRQGRQRVVRRASDWQPEIEEFDQGGRRGGQLARQV